MRVADMIPLRGWAAAAAASVPPVLFIARLCSRHGEGALPLGLLSVEWGVVLVAWRLLCPRLGRRGVVLAAVPFLLSFCVSSILAHEHLATLGTAWTGSDDVWFLAKAEIAADLLYSSGWNLPEAWSMLTAPGGGVSWTLAGWPFLLGLVSSLVTSDAVPEVLHAVALSMNATFLSLVLALVYNVLQEPARRFPRMVLACFLVVIGDPIVYAGHCLKESMLQLSLMLAFVSCVKLTRRIHAQWIVLGLLGIAGVATNRTAYLPLILLLLYWTVSDRIYLGTTLRVLIGVCLFVLFGEPILGHQIRGISLDEWMRGRPLEGDTGLAMEVYTIPVVGRVLYYAIAPVPPLPWKIASHDKIITLLLRSAGSIGWFFAACYVVHGTARNVLLFRDRCFLCAAILCAGLFAAAVIMGEDVRYKQPTNFYLAILLFLVWYDRRKTRGLPRVKTLQGENGSHRVEGRAEGLSRP